MSKLKSAEEKLNEAKLFNDNVVELQLSELEELINELKKCREDKEKLISAVEYLNNQIDEFNKKYSE